MESSTCCRIEQQLAKAVNMFSLLYVLQYNGLVSRNCNHAVDHLSNRFDQLHQQFQLERVPVILGIVTRCRLGKNALEIYPTGEPFICN